MGSEPFQRAFGDAPLLSVVGDVHALLATGVETGGAYALIETLVTPDNGPPPHIHSREEEAFYVLEGEVTSTVAGTPQVARPGTFVHAPRGIEHTFKNTGGRVARMLVMVQPAGLERFFREIGDPLPPGSTTPVPVTPAHVARIMEAAPRYGITIRAPS